jgi:hypothetical protein
MSKQSIDRQNWLRTKLRIFYKRKKRIEILRRILEANEREYNKR